MGQMAREYGDGRIEKTKIAKGHPFKCATGALHRPDCALQQPAWAGALQSLGNRGERNLLRLGFQGSRNHAAHRTNQRVFVGFSGDLHIHGCLQTLRDRCPSARKVVRATLDCSCPSWRYSNWRAEAPTSQWTTHPHPPCACCVRSGSGFTAKGWPTQASIPSSAK